MNDTESNVTDQLIIVKSVCSVIDLLLSRRKTRLFSSMEGKLKILS